MARFDLPWVVERLEDHQPSSIAPKVPPRQAAVAIILRGSGPQEPPGPPWEILFIRRTVQEGDPWSGHMAFPGGRMEADDRTPLDTARRETLEEVALDLEQGARHLGKLDDVWASARGQVLPLSISPHVFLQERQTALVCQPSEVELALWAPVVQLLSPEHATTVHYVLKGQHYDLPGICIQEQTIWGLTYQMLMSFFQLLQWNEEL